MKKLLVMLLVASSSLCAMEGGSEEKGMTRKELISNIQLFQRQIDYLLDRDSKDIAQSIASRLSLLGASHQTSVEAIMNRDSKLELINKEIELEGLNGVKVDSEEKTKELEKESDQELRRLFTEHKIRVLHCLKKQKKKAGIPRKEYISNILSLENEISDLKKSIREHQERSKEDAAQSIVTLKNFTGGGLVSVESVLRKFKSKWTLFAEEKRLEQILLPIFEQGGDSEKRTKELQEMGDEALVSLHERLLDYKTERRLYLSVFFYTY